MDTAGASMYLLCNTCCIFLALEQLVCEQLPVVVAGAAPDKAEQGKSEGSSPVQWSVRGKLLCSDVTKSGKCARGDRLELPQSSATQALSDRVWCVTVASACLCLQRLSLELSEIP